MYIYIYTHTHIYIHVYIYIYIYIYVTLQYSTVHHITLHYITLHYIMIMLSKCIPKSIVLALYSLSFIEILGVLFVCCGVVVSCILWFMFIVMLYVRFVNCAFEQRSWVLIVCVLLCEHFALGLTLSDDSEFRDVVFEDVVFDNNSFYQQYL